MTKFYPLSALAVACAIAPAQAQELPLEETVVVSSRVAMPLRHLGTSVSVLDAADIRQAGFNSLYDVLREAPGIGASANGGAGKPATLRIRGEEGYRTLVLLDGIDISDTTSTQSSPRMEHLMSKGVQRVEILRGPQGMMYGADAGGVIKISSFTPEEGFGGEASAEAGRYGTSDLSASLGLRGDSGDVSLSVSDFDTDGFNARDTDTDPADNDGYENTTVHAKAGWNIGEKFRVEGVVHDIDGANQYDNCYTNSFSPSNDCSNEYEQTAWRAAARYTGERFTHELSYADSQTDKQDYTEGEPTFGSEGGLERSAYQGSARFSDALQLVYGAEIKTESIDNGSFLHERDQIGYYLEYQGGFADTLFVTAGLRHDDNDDFGQHNSWRISGAWLIPASIGQFKVHGSAGTGFRAPSLYEIAYNQRPGVYPPAADTELKEETSQGYDLGLTWYGENGSTLEATWFDQRVDDGIYFDLITYSGYLQASGESSSSGVEMLAEIPIMDSLLFNANYTYNDSEQADGAPRARRPKHLANVGVKWLPMDERLVLSASLRGSYDAEDTDGTSLDDYQVLDLNASWRILGGLTIYGRVENALDEDYQEVPTYNTSGAAAYAGVRYEF